MPDSIEQNERFVGIRPKLDLKLVGDLIEGQAEASKLFGRGPLLVEPGPGLSQFPRRAGPSSRT